MPYAFRGANTQLIIFAPADAGAQAPEQGTATVGLGSRGTGNKVVAVTGRCSAGLYGRTAAVRKVAQTGRASVGVFPDVAANFHVTAGSFTHVTITRDYDLATGEAPTGKVWFTPSGWLLNNKVTVVAAAVPAVLDVDGRISLGLAANTDPDTVPVDSYYTVREEIIGQPTRSYKVSVPYDEGLTVDLATLPVIP